MTLKELLEDYKGFNYDGEVVVVDTFAGKAYICRWDGKALNHPYHSFGYEYDINVRNWNHSEKTMVITI